MIKKETFLGFLLLASIGNTMQGLWRRTPGTFAVLNKTTSGSLQVKVTYEKKPGATGVTCSSETKEITPAGQPPTDMLEFPFTKNEGKCDLTRFSLQIIKEDGTREDIVDYFIDPTFRLWTLFMVTKTKGRYVVTKERM